jgi:hypothetical protein
LLDVGVRRGLAVGEELLEEGHQDDALLVPELDGPRRLESVAVWASER